MVQTQKPLKARSSSASFASDKGYFFLPPGSPGGSEITETQYRGLINEFQIKYSMAVFKFTGKPLVIPHEWDSPYFAGFAIDKGAYMQISLWGGTARAPEATIPALAGILCHELGHILAGAPNQTLSGSEWSSTEGQSDFYAARDCLPEFLKEHPELLTTVEPEVLSVCQGHKLCARTAQAGLDLVRFFNRFDPIQIKTLSVLKPASASSHLLVNVYPSNQCRLDTYVQGALCQLEGSCRAPVCWLPADQE